MSQTCIVRLSTKLCDLTALRKSFSYTGMDCKLRAGMKVERVGVQIDAERKTHEGERAMR
jgi:hypothetical protein